jgi:hypothetical protein
MLLLIDVTLDSKRLMWQSDLQGRLWYGGLRPRNLTMDASNTVSFVSDPGASLHSGAKMGPGISGDASKGTRPRSEGKDVERKAAEVEGPEPPEFAFSVDDITRKFPELGEDSDDDEGGGGSESEGEEGEEEGEEEGGEGEGEGDCEKGVCMKKEASGT